jgi:hypothetical protein
MHQTSQELEKAIARTSVQRVRADPVARSAGQGGAGRGVKACASRLIARRSFDQLGRTLSFEGEIGKGRRPTHAPCVFTRS